VTLQPAKARVALVPPVVVQVLQAHASHAPQQPQQPQQPRQPQRPQRLQQPQRHMFLVPTAHAAPPPVVSRVFLTAMNGALPPSVGGTPLAAMEEIPAPASTEGIFGPMGIGTSFQKNDQNSYCQCCQFGHPCRCPTMVTCSSSGAGGANQSLNTDPYTHRSEELALAECMRGMEVRRVWSEQAMVCTFGGHMLPGTPDGMFESWDGALICVQVVRVPFVAGMSPELMQEVLAQTLLTKVVKSQQWLRACRTVPQDFIIFCWLPFTIPDCVAEGAELLMQRVRELDPRFSHRLRVPAQPGALFPAQFAHVGASHKSEPRSKSVSESDVCVFSTAYSDSDDEDEECAWDITWAWDSELCGFGSPSPSSTEESSGLDVLEECESADERDDLETPEVGEEVGEEEFEFEWDITWEWQRGGCEWEPQVEESEEECESEKPVTSLGTCTYDQQQRRARLTTGLPWDDGG